MLSLRIELLTGRYVASAFNDRNRPEWPPHPARVFSALVAAHYEGGQPEGGEAALRWLEAQRAPHLTFSGASARDLKTHYVPVNDKALSDGSMVDNAWAKVLAPALTDRQQARAEEGLARAYAKAGAEDKKLAKTFAEAVAHVLPASRTRQPRTFPSVTPEEPVLWLSWDASPGVEVRAGLDALAARLVRVGHSSSLVAARWTDDEPAPTWTPDPSGGEILRWVGPGQLDRLDELHDGHPFAEQRVMPYAVARYRAGEPKVKDPSSSFADSFIVLRRVEGARVPVLAAELITGAVRRALMSHADDDTPPLISGHAAGGGPLQADHLAIAPLAYVGSRHASGDVLGVALMPPAGLELDELRPLHQALARWEAAEASADGVPRVGLNMGRLGRWVLERSLDISPLHNLRESTWARASSCWASVTPMVLDRHPGQLHGGGQAQRAKAIARANTLVAQACARVGLPTPIEIELSPSPFFNGVDNASRFRRRRREGARDRRPMIHARLTFAAPVAGPVLLGAGRYRGLGLFRPIGGRHG